MVSRTYIDDLIELSSYLEKTAELVREHAKTLRGVALYDEGKASRLASILSVLELVDVRVSEGQNLDAAMTMAARESGLPIDHIAAQLHWRASRRKVRSREARDVEVMRLAEAGWRNAQIARELRISGNTVSRIVRRQVLLWKAAAE